MPEPTPAAGGEAAAAAAAAPASIPQTAAPAEGLIATIAAAAAQRTPPPADHEPELLTPETLAAAGETELLTPSAVADQAGDPALAAAVAENAESSEGEPGRRRRRRRRRRRGKGGADQLGDSDEGEADGDGSEPPDAGAQAASAVVTVTARRTGNRPAGDRSRGAHPEPTSPATTGPGPTGSAEPVPGTETSAQPEALGALPQPSPGPAAPTSETAAEANPAAQNPAAKQADADPPLSPISAVSAPRGLPSRSVPPATSNRDPQGSRDPQANRDSQVRRDGGRDGRRDQRSQPPGSNSPVSGQVAANQPSAPPAARPARPRHDGAQRPVPSVLDRLCTFTRGILELCDPSTPSWAQPRLAELLAEIGVVPTPCTGAPHPDFHVVVGEEAAQGIAPGSISVVVSPGFSLRGDRGDLFPLRKAQVKTTAKPAEAAQPTIPEAAAPAPSSAQPEAILDEAEAERVARAELAAERAASEAKRKAADTARQQAEAKRLAAEEAKRAEREAELAAWAERDAERTAPATTRPAEAVHAVGTQERLPIAAVAETAISPESPAKQVEAVLAEAPAQAPEPVLAHAPAADAGPAETIAPSPPNELSEATTIPVEGSGPKAEPSAPTTGDARNRSRVRDASRLIQHTPEPARGRPPMRAHAREDASQAPALPLAMQTPDDLAQRPKAEGFRKLGLNEQILADVASCGYVQPTPIQEEAIPHVLAGRDLVGQAQTGTGKTAAFALPALQLLYAVESHDPPLPVGLMLCPTRELARQVHSELTKFAGQSGARAALIYGGVDMDAQFRELQRRPHLIVGTPGRIIDHMKRRTLDLSRLRFCVLDEADQMLDIGFWPDVTWIIGHTPPTRQMMLFSATFPDPVRELAEKHMREPVHVRIAPKQVTVEQVDQKYICVPHDRKNDLLAHFIETFDPPQLVVFCRTRHQTDRVAEVLKRKHMSAGAIHGDLPQSRRERTLTAFRAGELQCLVATNVAARGLDIPTVSHVVNYDIPEAPEEYVHRIGRTARNGARGVARTFITPEDGQFLTEIEKHIGLLLEEEKVPGFEPPPPPVVERTIATSVAGAPRMLKPVIGPIKLPRRRR